MKIRQKRIHQSIVARVRQKMIRLKMVHLSSVFDSDHTKSDRSVGFVLSVVPRARAHTTYVIARNKRGDILEPWSTVDIFSRNWVSQSVDLVIPNQQYQCDPRIVDRSITNIGRFGHAFSFEVKVMPVGRLLQPVGQTVHHPSRFPHESIYRINSIMLTEKNGGGKMTIGLQCFI